MKFCWNIDESTSSNHMIVLTSYFCPLVSKVVIQHLVSLSVATVTSERLYNEIVQFFDDNQIPWENLMSIQIRFLQSYEGIKKWS